MSLPHLGSFADHRVDCDFDSKKSIPRLLKTKQSTLPLTIKNSTSLHPESNPSSIKKAKKKNEIDSKRPKKQTASSQ